MISIGFGGIEYHVFHFFTGNIKRHLHTLPTKAGQYKKGQSLAYRIDFLNADETINFRIYISKVLLAMLPMVFHGKDAPEVDVVVLCVAFFDYVKRHAQAIIAHLKPRTPFCLTGKNFSSPEINSRNIP
jgi:hypothetical protein